MTDSVDEAVEEIEGFYRNYHSSRYVGGQLVMRVRRAPQDEQLEALNDEFADLLEVRSDRARRGAPGGGRRVGRICRGCVLQFDRKKVGLLRALIDRLNAEVDDVRPPRDARRREIFEAPLPEAQAEAELEEDE